jgi:hypothetical protein
MQGKPAAYPVPQPHNETAYSRLLRMGSDAGAIT